MILLTCYATILINMTDFPWNRHDYKTKLSAEETCERVYNQCLYKFIKYDKQDYHALCKESKHENNYITMFR